MVVGSINMLLHLHIVRPVGPSGIIYHFQLFWLSNKLWEGMTEIIAERSVGDDRAILSEAVGQSIFDLDYTMSGLWSSNRTISLVLFDCNK